MNKAIESNVLNVEILTTLPISNKLNWFEKLIAKIRKIKTVSTNHYQCRFTIEIPNYYKIGDIVVSNDGNCIGWQVHFIDINSITFVTLKPVELSLPITNISKIMLISSSYHG